METPEISKKGRNIAKKFLRLEGVDFQSFDTWKMRIFKMVTDFAKKPERAPTSRRPATMRVATVVAAGSPKCMEVYGGWKSGSRHRGLGHPSRAPSSRLQPRGVAHLGVSAGSPSSGWMAECEMNGILWSPIDFPCYITYHIKFLLLSST